MTTELRHNPLLGTWTMVSAGRQHRPVLQRGACPFCPGSGQVPDDYDVLSYPNDFPVLSREFSSDESIDRKTGRVFQTAPSYGAAEVILYSSDHTKSFATLPASQIEKVIDLWVQRCRALGADGRIKYVFPFENRGEEVGVTMLHPHGQLYAYPFVPLKLKVELEQCAQFYHREGRCLICDLTEAEHADGARIITENDGFSCYIPYFTDFPYGVFVVSKKHRASLLELDAAERRDLALALKSITTAFDRLFSRPFPYMMCLHQQPVNCPEYHGSEQYFHLHIEFYPPLRAKDRIKWYASSEMGAWAAANPVVVEDSAAQLRKVVQGLSGSE